MPTEQEYIDLIQAELGDTVSGALAANIDLLWSRFDSITDLDLHYLYAKRAAIDLLLGQVRAQVSFKTSSGSEVDLDQLFQHLLKLRESLELELASSSAGGVGAGMAIGELTTTAPIMRDRAGQRDPNRRSLRGDPLKRWPS